MARSALRPLVFCLVIAAAFAFAMDAPAQGMNCSGPYWNSSSYNFNTYPAQGGCWLSGSICYECWTTVSYETAGCTTLGECRSILGLAPETQTASTSLPVVGLVAVRVCHRPHPAMATVADAKHLL